MAVYAAADPEWTTCGQCDCVDGQSRIERWELKGIVKTNRCPRYFTSHSSRGWLALYSGWKSGFLAVAGGLMDQPAHYVEAMRLIEHHANEAHSG